MKKNTCPKCYVDLVLGTALVNPIGKLDHRGMFIPSELCNYGDTVYPVHSQVIMTPVNKCPKCGYSVIEI